MKKFLIIIAFLIYIYILGWGILTIISEFNRLGNEYLKGLYESTESQNIF